MENSSRTPSTSTRKQLSRKALSPWLGLDPVAQIELLGRKELVDEPDRDRAFTDRRGDAVERPMTDVAGGEYTGHAGLERERTALEGPASVVVEIRSGMDEPAAFPRA